MAAEHLDRLSLPAPVFNPMALLEGKPSTTVAAPPELRARLDDLRDQLARKSGRFTKAQVQARADRIRLLKEKRKTAAAVLAYQQGEVA